MKIDLITWGKRKSLEGEESEDWNRKFNKRVLSKWVRKRNLVSFLSSQLVRIHVSLLSHSFTSLTNTSSFLLSERETYITIERSFQAGDSWQGNHEKSVRWWVLEWHRQQNEDELPFDRQWKDFSPKETEGKVANVSTGMKCSLRDECAGDQKLCVTCHHCLHKLRSPQHLPISWRVIHDGGD